MKGYSATMVIGIIVAVIIAVFILYIAWAKGFLPFSQATSEAQCKSYFSEECQRSAELGWDPSVFKHVKGCKSYVNNTKAFDCCVNNKCENIADKTNPYDPSNENGRCYMLEEEECRKIACRDLCSEFTG